MKMSDAKLAREMKWGTTLCAPAKRGLNWLWIAGLAFSLSFWATVAYVVITW